MCENVFVWRCAVHEWAWKRIHVFVCVRMCLCPRSQYFMVRCLSVQLQPIFVCVCVCVCLRRVWPRRCVVRLFAAVLWSPLVVLCLSKKRVDWWFAWPYGVQARPLCALEMQALVRVAVCWPEYKARGELLFVVFFECHLLQPHTVSVHSPVVMLLQESTVLMLQTGNDPDLNQSRIALSLSESAFGVWHLCCLLVLIFTQLLAGGIVRFRALAYSSRVDLNQNPFLGFFFLILACRANIQFDQRVIRAQNIIFGIFQPANPSISSCFCCKYHNEIMNKIPLLCYCCELAYF